MNRRGALDAVVVGGGAIGAALALALGRDGFDVALVEARAPKPWRIGDDVDLRVVALAPDARALLDDLGAWRAIESARAGAYRCMRVWDALAPGELRFDAADRGEASLGWIVENALIQHALWQALVDEPRVVLRCPAEVAAVSDAGSLVEVALADGTRMSARAVLAADGAASPVRAMAGIDCADRDYEQRAIVAHVRTERPHEDTAWQRFLPGGPLAFLPLADGRSSIVWTLADADAERMLALDDGAFRAELGCAFDFRLGGILSSTRRAAFPLRMRSARRYVAGRIALVGDAAHVVHPLAGQGMNLGLRDVACLRRVLRSARESGSDIGAVHVLRRYERERRSENVLAARALDAIERVFGSTNPTAVAARGLALSTVGHLAPLREIMMGAASGRF
ncbi:MAG TPA: UbiH/UbiF/VisC/COQ6 family ubiquinone biosynthesis hydroxylase [Rhodanobacteraceae bacterium]|nr:UbiH/UbiF/VisC/COQ6 family ubiquinone biosynthesis hydroxylase [Rhodanobacteraceae bacterium]